MTVTITVDDTTLQHARSLMEKIETYAQKSNYAYYFETQRLNAQRAEAEMELANLFIGLLNQVEDGKAN